MAKNVRFEGGVQILAPIPKCLGPRTACGQEESPVLRSCGSLMKTLHVVSATTGLIACVAVGTGFAQGLMPPPANPTFQACSTMRENNYKVFQATVDRLYALGRERAKIYAECVGLPGQAQSSCLSRLPAYDARLHRMRQETDEMSRQSGAYNDQCSSAASARRAAEQDMARRTQLSQDQLARQSADQRRAQDAAAASQRASAPEKLNQAYETARQTYNDAKRVGNLVTNPREEIGRIAAEKIEEFGQQGTERALRGPAPPQHPEYSAAHDRIKDINDAAARNEGVKTIQDASLDELKRRNNQTLAAIEALDKQIAEFNQSSSTQTRSGGSISVGTLRAPEQRASTLDSATNPWGNVSGVANDGDGRRPAASGADLPRISTPQSSSAGSAEPSGAEGNDSNPWADSSVGKQGGGNSPSIALASPSDLTAASNPWASGASSTPTQTLTYLDPGTGTDYKIPKGYTLFRDAKTGKLSVVKSTKTMRSAGGDRPDSTACSNNGLGIVTPDCEAKRASGS